MNLYIIKIIQDIALTTLWAITIYFIASAIAEPFNKLITHKTIVFFLVLCTSILVAPKTLSLARRYKNTQKLPGYKSSVLLNIILGLFLSCAAMLVLPDNRNIVSLSQAILSTIVGSIVFAFIFSKLIPEKNKTDITTSSEDLLDREKFIGKVLHLLKNPDNLISNTQNESLIIWIASNWGSGKTWILNEIQHRFLKTDQSKRTIWLSFNPWLQSSPKPEQDLIESFFEQLSIKVNEDFLLEDLNKNILQYKEAILVQTAKKLFGVEINNIFSPEKPTDELKKSISAFLLDNKIKLVITFDEIDRLTPNEMVTCLRLIRSLANFANTVIIVCGASDKTTELIKESGLPADYLEKIAQVPLAIPYTRTNDFIDILWKHIKGDNLPDEQKKVLGGAFKNLRLNISSDNNQQVLLNNLRTIKRLADTIKVDFIDKNRIHDINAFDFINLQIIRLNCLPLYERIRDNKSIWAGKKSVSRDIADTFDDENNQKSLLLKTMDKLAEEALHDLERKMIKKESLKKILSQMFPRYQKGIKTYHYIGVDESNRIYDPKFFDRYFVEDLPIGEVSNETIFTLVFEWKEKKDIKESLANFSDEDIVWIIRELVTTKPIELPSKVKKALVKFIIDEKFDHKKTYEAHNFKLEVEDIVLGKNNDYKEIITYFLSKSDKVDLSFKDACYYFNSLYWNQRRRGIEGVSQEDIKDWQKIIIDAFNKRFLHKEKNLFELPKEDMHTYWYFFTRDNPDFDADLRNNIKNQIQEDVSKFCDYLYMYREYIYEKSPSFSNNYKSFNGFTSENIELARKFLQQDGISEIQKKDLEDFIRIALDNMPGKNNKNK